jgi:hypothetical protein
MCTAAQLKDATILACRIRRNLVGYTTTGGRRAVARKRSDVKEIVPLLSGAVLGYLVGGMRASKRLAIALSLAIPLGIVASWVTGELSISWGFVLVDIPLVAVSAGACVVVRSVRRDGLSSIPFLARKPNG